MKMSEMMDEDKEVPEIMHKLRENATKSASCQPYEKMGEESDMQTELAQIRSNWDIRNKNYQIHSHRPYTGKALVKGRELVHSEVQRYVDPMIGKQIEFNNNVSIILDKQISKIGDIETDIADAKLKIECQINDIFAEINKFRLDVDSMMDNKINNILGEIKEDIENKAWLAAILERRTASEIISPKVQSTDSGLNYFLFEERFRGSRVEIKEKQQAFVDYFRGCRKVLDIGCGRGEFLELLKENGIEAIGIDIDPDMVSYCTSKGLNVELKDAVTYLENIDDKTLDGIFLDQVVEHFEPFYLTRLLDLCYRKLNYGYFIIIETVNPLSLFSFINFFIDLTHIHPLHPATLNFLLTAFGFRELETKFLAPIADSQKLKRLDTSAQTTDEIKEFVNIYNKNTEVLNNILYGPQDYAIIGKK